MDASPTLHLLRSLITIGGKQLRAVHNHQNRRAPAHGCGTPASPTKRRVLNMNSTTPEIRSCNICKIAKPEHSNLPCGLPGGSG